MSLTIASLYLLCLASLFGSAIYVFSRNPLSKLNASYALLSLTLIGWVGSLFLFNSQPEGSALLWIGRFNFAAVALMAAATYQFVRILSRKTNPYLVWMLIETAILAGISLLTSLVDRTETVIAGQHITAYGILFPVFVLHIVYFVALALCDAFRPTAGLQRQIKQQLRLVGIGILVTAVVGVFTNALIPYVFGNFHYIDIGTLATIFFLGAVAYAASVHHLFNIRVVIRATIFIGVLIAFTLELYQVSVEFLTQLLPLGDPSQQHVAAATIALTINAFTHEPLRLWLEQILDKLMKRNHKESHPHLR